MKALIASGAILMAAGLLVAEPAAATPKKALGDYSQVCKDEHLRCLNDCQKNYSSDSDIRTCFGVCDDWLDTACDVAFPKAMKNQSGGTVVPPKVKLLDLPSLQSTQEAPQVPKTGGTFGAEGQGQPQLHVLQPQLKILQPQVFGSPISVPCLMRGGELIWIENTTGIYLPKGTPINWQTSAGQQGTSPLPRAVGANLPMEVTNANQAESCTAQVVPPPPVLSPQ
jgi:hypothetical protein